MSENGGKPELDETNFAEGIFRLSDISHLSKWPLRIAGGFCLLAWLVIWYARQDWLRYLNTQDFAYIVTITRALTTLATVLKISLVLTVVLVVASFITFLALFFKSKTPRAMDEASRELLVNSFFFGVSLIFVISAVSESRAAARQIVEATNARIQCARNLEVLGRALIHYAEQNQHRYPGPDNWCDTLIEYADVNEQDFICPAAAEGRCHYALNPNAVPLSACDDMESFARSRGIDFQKAVEDNPRVHEVIFKAYLENCFESYRQRRYIQEYFADGPLSYKRDFKHAVLLFESKSGPGPRGWNQYGGPELLNTENHGGEGCNIAFNDGHVEFVKTEDLNKLNWGTSEQ